MEGATNDNDKKSFTHLHFVIALEHFSVNDITEQNQQIVKFQSTCTFEI